MSKRIPKRISTAILKSLAAGVVPRTGLEYIAVGRADEINALIDDVENVIAEGGASFRLILGRYGSGKSFLGQLVRSKALAQNFVVADADLSPTRRLTGSKGQGLSLYRELLNNLATRTRPDGNAFPVILERWITDVQNSVMQEGISPGSPEFSSAVERRIHQTINEMEGMVHGFDFATVITAYWNGHQEGIDTKKDAALRWLRGEFSTKTEARQALGVRVIINDSDWYDYIKLLARFVKEIGYSGLLIFVDEGVNLYKISNSKSRNNNYEYLLTIFNDALQGRAQYLGFILSGTPQMVEDRGRGLFSYEALKTRLEESRFAKVGFRDLTSPLIRLEVLSPEEIFLLLQRLREVHGIHHKYEPRITDQQIQQFMQEIQNRLGAEQFLTPREVVRDFIFVLNTLHQHEDQSMESVIGSSDFVPSTPTDDPEELRPDTEIIDEDSPYSNFEI